MTTYVFDKIEHRAVKTVACSRCGKKLRRQKTFWATENPFNVSEQGVQRNRAEIREQLRKEAAAWMTEPEQHATCPEGRV